MTSPIVSIANDESYKRLYEELQDEIKLFRTILPSSALKEIESLRLDKDRLTNEVSNLQGQIAQTEQTIREIKEQCDKRIAELNKKHEVGLAKQRGVHDNRKIDIANLDSQVKNLQGSNRKLQAELVEKEKLLVEQNALLLSREEELKRIAEVKEEIIKLSEKIDSMRDMFNESLESIKVSITSKVKDEKIVEELVEEVEEQQEKVESGRKPTKAEKEELCRIIKSLASQTHTNREIAELLMVNKNQWFVGLSSLNAAEQKVGRYMKMNYYLTL